MSLDLNKIKEELKRLPKFKAPFLNQICLQGVEDNPDPFFGCGKVDSLEPHKETDFVHPNFNMPYINSILTKLGMYRTRVLKLGPASCYSIHRDPTKRIHIPIVTSDKCLLIVNNEVMYLPADGSYYEIDTTHRHTAINGTRNLERIHIVGCIKGD